MNRFLLSMPFVVAVIATTFAAKAAEAPAPLTFYVATNGNDNWSGKLAKPNEARTDGPLASLAGARNALRKSRAGSAIGAATVFVGGGDYRLGEVFRLEPEDSGTAEAPVVYAAYQNEHPVFSGGRPITGFRQKGKLWETTIPEVKAGQWYFRQLFINGERRQRARSPNEGYFRIAELAPGPVDNASKRAVARNRFIFKDGDLRPVARLNDVELTLMHSWETSIHPLKSVDTNSHMVEFAAPLKEWWSIGYWETAQRYFVENAFEYLDSPGEWYLNRESGVLSYWPLPGERIEKAEVIAPRLQELVRFAGHADGGEFVQHVTLRGLNFHHADWKLKPEGNSSTQAAVEEPAVVIADGALHCAVENCEVAHVGTYGIWFRRGCKDCRVQQNRLFDLGAGGIRVGEAKMAKTDAAESSRNLIDNNHVYDGGRVYPAGIGIWLAQSSHNRISNNDIHDLFYSGMSVGWNWNDATNRTHHNLIEFNHVHHLGHGVLSDAGLIYCLGASPGSVIRNNVFHDIWPYETPPFGWGIYFDATCSGYLCESNVVFNTRSGGVFWNNGGHEHVIQNNIFALSADYGVWPFWERRPATFRRNIVYLTQGALFVPHAESSLEQRRQAHEPLGTWDDNLYWHTAQKDDLRFFGHDFAEWRALGLDADSVIVDPRFADAADYDFRLKRNSPALKLGFGQIDISNVGLYGERSWRNECRHSQCPKTKLPAPPAPPKPREVSDGFEDTAVGSHPSGARVDGEQSRASIRVSAERAATGERSLKIADARDLKPEWQPHFYYEPHLTAGTVRQQFDVWFETNAQFIVEWRDAGPYPANIGPSIRFDRGQISAAGKTLLTVPATQWIHVAVESALGKSSPRHFKLSLRAGNEATREFTDLPFSGKDFHELHWLGFASIAAADTAFYLDDIELKHVRR